MLYVSIPHQRTHNDQVGRLPTRIVFSWKSLKILKLCYSPSVALQVYIQWHDLQIRTIKIAWVGRLWPNFCSLIWLAGGKIRVSVYLLLSLERNVSNSICGPDTRNTALNQISSKEQFCWSLRGSWNVNAEPLRAGNHNIWHIHYAFAGQQSLQPRKWRQDDTRNIVFLRTAHTTQGCQLYSSRKQCTSIVRLSTAVPGNHLPIIWIVCLL